MVRVIDRAAQFWEGNYMNVNRTWCVCVCVVGTTQGSRVLDYWLISMATCPYIVCCHGNLKEGKGDRACNAIA